MQIRCHHCGRKIPVSEFARQIGKIGKGAAKRRNIDYAALARKSHESRARNQAKKSSDGKRISLDSKT